jgi:hypothetical protein
MPRLVTLTLAFFALMVLAVPAVAVPIGFSGYYAPANWTIGDAARANPPSWGGSVDWSAAPGSATINGEWTGTSMWMIAPVGGTVSFSYNVGDHTQGDLYTYQGGTWVDIAGTNGPGTYSYWVNAGGVIGIDVGGAYPGASDPVQIFNFDAATPEPSTVALIGLGGVALALMRRKRA